MLAYIWFCNSILWPKVIVYTAYKEQQWVIFFTKSNTRGHSTIYLSIYISKLKFKKILQDESFNSHTRKPKSHNKMANCCCLVFTNHGFLVYTCAKQNNFKNKYIIYLFFLYSKITKNCWQRLCIDLILCSTFWYM